MSKLTSFIQIIGWFLGGGGLISKTKSSRNLRILPVNIVDGMYYTAKIWKESADPDP